MTVSALSVGFSGSNSTRLLKHGITGQTDEMVAVSWMAKPWGKSSRWVRVRTPAGLGRVRRYEDGRGERQNGAARDERDGGHGSSSILPPVAPARRPGRAGTAAAAQDAAVSREDSGTSTSTRSVNFRASPARRAPTPTTRRATISSRSS